MVDSWVRRTRSAVHEGQNLAFMTIPPALIAPPAERPRGSAAPACAGAGSGLSRGRRVVWANGAAGRSTVFEVHTPLTPEQLTLTEGQALAAFTPDEALRLNLAHFCRQVLERYDAAESPR